MNQMTANEYGIEMLSPCPFKIGDVVRVIAVDGNAEGLPMTVSSTSAWCTESNIECTWYQVIDGEGAIRRAEFDAACLEHCLPLAVEAPVSVREDGSSCFPMLTSREREVAIALSLGFKNAEIAKSLGISIKTVDTHRGHVLAKVGVRNNVELAREALRVGLVDLGFRLSDVK